MSARIPSPVDRIVDAINRGDTAALLDFFDDKSVVDDWGDRYVGRAAIKKWSDRELIGAKGVMTASKGTRTSDKITISADWKSSFYSGRSRIVFTIDGESVREMHILSE